jgi:hypothetical protein
VVAVDAAVGLGVEIVAKAPLPGDGMVVGGHIHFPQAELAVMAIHETPAAEPG